MPSAVSGGTLSKLWQAPFALNNDEIKQLAPGGVDLVPALDADRLLIPTLLVMKVDTTAGEYTNVGDVVSVSLGGSLSPIGEPILPYSAAKVAFGGIPGSASTIIAGMTPLILASAPEINDWGQFAYGFRNVGGPIGGLPIKLRVNNYTAGWGEDLGSFTGGHDANTLKGVVEYRIFNLATQVFE